MHCRARKHNEHAQTWFGACVRPRDQALRFGLDLDFPWKQDDTRDVLTKSKGKPCNLTALLRAAAKARAKIGFGDFCRCGSGKKHKKCCLA